MQSNEHNSNRRPLHQSIFEALEERVLFDGVPDAPFIGPAPATEPMPDQAPTVQFQSLEQADPAPPRALIIIDPAVPDSSQLLASILDSETNTAFEVRLLDGHSDGVSEITGVLADNKNQYDAVHIISHGEAGKIELGNTTLSNDNLHHYIDELVSWSNALSDNADLLFYGCNLAGDADGEMFLESMRAVTGADVAASDDLTGSASADGDWELEFALGNIQTAALSATNWQGTLAIEAIDGAVSIVDAEGSTAGTVTLTNNSLPETVTIIGTPQRVGQMLERVWQFSETADTGRATYVFDVSSVAGINATIAAQFGLIISDQADLSGTNTTTLVASGYDAVNQLVYFHQVDLVSGDYFGLATEVVQDNFEIAPVASGAEDSAIDLGLTLRPALTDGGQLRDIIGTDTGYRSSTAGAASTDFLIPAGTTGIKITGYSTRDINTGNTNNDATNDDYQFLNASIDLDTEQSNGFIGHIIDQGPSRSDQFGWSGAPLGTGVLSGGATVTGDANDNINPVFTIVDGVLQIVENHPLQTAYHVEFLTNATSSSDFIQTASAVREDGDQTDVSLTVPANADYLIISIADAATSSNSAVEYKGNSRIYVDLNTLTASGVVAAQRGETDNRVLTYAFEDYDISSNGTGTILNGATSIVGDTQQSAGLNNDNQIYIDSTGNLIINRDNSFASGFNSLVTVEYYDRKDVGSSAAALGQATAYGTWNSDPSDPISTLDFDIPENATLGILNLSMNGTRTSDTNENMGAGFAVIDLVNGTSSGTIYMVRASNIVDLVAWDQTGFGTEFFDDPNSISNHTTINQFNDKFAGNARFNLVNGGDTLQLATNSPDGTQTFRDYLAGGQIEWYGSRPLEVAGFLTGGTFNQGSLNPNTGNWELTIAQAQSGLSFLPDTHVSSMSPFPVSITIGNETETISVRVEAVIDPISFTTVDACGDEDTDISISANVAPVFVDADGSESVTSLVLSEIPVGHTISDGTNNFTATTSSQSADITAWDQSLLTYRAPPNESGTFTLKLDVDWQDVGGGVTDTDSISTNFDIVVKSINDNPVAVDNNYTVLGNTTLTVSSSSGLLNNDSDADLDSLTVNTTPVSGPSNGMVTLGSDGSFVYTPTGGFSGPDSFVYQITDNNGGFDTATAFIDVSDPVTGPLMANPDTVMTNEEVSINIAVMGNDNLPTTGAFNIQSTTPPTNGSILVLPNGTIDYTPDADFFGTDTFTYTLADASGRTSTATVTVDVANVQDPPTANADSGSTAEDVTLPNINILGNDSDPDNDALTVTMATAANGMVTINGDGTIDYTPNANFFGSDTINYTISDNNGGFASSTVLINVSPDPDPPTSSDQTVTVDEDDVYLFAGSDFAFADADASDSLVTVRIDTLPADGQLLFDGVAVVPGQIVSLSAINAARLTFAPAANGFGSAYTTFTFSVSDGALFQTMPNTITVDVIPLPDAPLVFDDTLTVAEESTGTPINITPPTDPDLDTLTATITGLPTLGNVFLADGTTRVSNGDVLTIAQLTTLVFDGPIDYSTGSIPGDLTYDVFDGITTVSGSVAITITPVNDPPEICLEGHVTTGNTFIDDRSGFNIALNNNPASTVIDDGGAFAADPTTGTAASITRSGTVAGQPFSYTVYDVDFSNTPTGTITPGVVGGDINDLDNLVIESPVSQGAATGSGSWGVDSATGQTSTRNALLFDFTNTGGNNGIGHFGAEFHDTEGDPAFTAVQFRVYKAGVLIDSGTIDWGTGNNGNNESHFFGYVATSAAMSFDQIAILVGDQNAGGGLGERLAADRFTFGAASAEPICQADHIDTFIEGGSPVSLIGPTSSIIDVDDTSFPTFAIDVGLATIADTNQEHLTINGTDFPLDAVNDSITTVTVGGIDYSVSWTAAATTLNFVRDDATEMSGPEITAVLAAINYRNDAVLPTESDRTFDVTIDDGDDVSNIATSTITVVRSVESVLWTVTGDASVIDGNHAAYNLSLSAPMRAGETASVDLALANIDTTNADTGTLNAAITTAVAAYSGPGAVTWNGTTLTFTSAGNGPMSSLTINLPTSPDGIYEGNEDYSINLSNPATTTGQDVSLGAFSTVQTTIIDNDPAPTVLISDGSADEGDAVEFTISTDIGSTEDITLDLSVTSGSAIAGVDFQTTNFEFFDGSVWQPAANGSQVTLPAGTMSLLVRVDSIQDGAVEPDETFGISATVLSGTVTASSDTGVGTIVNDDLALLNIGDVTIDEDNGFLTFTIALDQPPTSTISVNYATGTTGTATAGTDFTATSGTLTFNPGQQTQTIVVAVANDDLYEQSETVVVNLLMASGGTIVDGEGIGTIIDDGSGPNGTDDDRPVISISNPSVTEGDDTHAVFTLSLSNPSVEDIDLSLALVEGSASNGTDFGPGLEYFDGTMWQPVAASVTIAAGETSVQIRTPILDDAIIDGGETFSLIATQVAGTTLNSSATGTGTIADDPVPDPTTVGLIGPPNVTEGNMATYTVTLDNTPLTDVTVTFTYAGIAAGGTDYSGVASVTIPGGNTMATFDVATIDDSLGEPLENVIVSIDTITGGSLEGLQISPTANSVTTNIVDDDVPVIAVNDVIVTEDLDPYAEFTVELSNPTFETILFDLTATSGTATGGGVDFGVLGVDDLEVFDGTTWTPAASASIAAGTTSARFRILILDDAFAEIMESFTVTATTIAGTTSNPADSGTGTILDEPTALDTVLVSIAGPPSVLEGDTTTPYTLSLTEIAAEDVSITLSYSGTAFDGSDFSGVAVVSIPTGSNSAIFMLPTLDDTLYEANESIIVTIDSVTGGGFEGIAVDMASAQVTTLITDTADIPTVSINDVAAVEGTDDWAVYTIELSNLSVEDISVSLSLADGTALSTGTDFGSAGVGNLQVFNGTTWVDAATATIAGGEYSVQVRVPIIDDSIDEPDENYTLTVDVIAGTTANIQLVGTGTIIDDDAAPHITIADAIADEGDPLVFAVTLSNPSSTDIVLDFLATGGTASTTTDYNAATLDYSSDGGATWTPATGGTEVTFAAESTSLLVRVATTEDITLEPTETMQLSIASVVAGLTGDTTDTAVGTIFDDDTALVSITANDANSSETADNGQFTVTLSNPSSTPTTVVYSVGGTADGGIDFAPITGTITFAAGQTAATIDLIPVDDAVVEGIENVTLTLTSIVSGDPDINIDAGAGSATAVLNDNDSATWRLAGTGTVNEGGVTTWNLSLDGTLQSGQSVTVELDIADVTTQPDDYADFSIAVGAAVSGYVGPGGLAWDGTALTFTSDGTGAMTTLPIELLAINDAVVEGAESLTISISNEGSLTGATVGIDALDNAITTIIQDTSNAAGTELDTANWSITGAATVNESQTIDYTVTLDTPLQSGETATVDISFVDIDTAAGDVTDLSSAVTAAIANYVTAALPGTLAWDGTTLTFTSSGAPMGDLTIQLTPPDDSLQESAEDYQLQITNPTSTTGSMIAIDSANDQVTTTIQPAVDQSFWTIVGDVSGDEGAVVRYTIALSGLFGAGTSAAIDLGQLDNSTNASDYTDFTAAISTAIGSRTDVTFDGTTLTWNATADGESMADLIIDLGITDDSLIEGAETYTIRLVNPTSVSGIAVATSPASDSVTTIINDTVGVGGAADAGTWSITGPAASSEGATAQYTIALSGVFGSGEATSVVVDLTDVSTNANDHAAFVAAVATAAATNPDVTFDAGTMTLTYTASADGDSMADMVVDLGINSDAIVEGPESFEIGLVSESSTTGAATLIDAANNKVTTLVNDLTAPASWNISGPAFADEGDTAQFLIGLDGQMGLGESVTVTIGLADLTTSSSDRANLSAAIAVAVAGNADLTWDGLMDTLTFTASTEGATLAPIVVNLAITDDVFVEGPEQFSIGLTGPTSSTGSTVIVAPTAASVTTQINDTIGPGGASDGTIEWSISGDQSVAEGADAIYTIALSESFGAGQVVSVDVAISDIDTNSSDYGALLTAVSDAVAAYAGLGTVAFDGTTITYMSTNDGDSMSDIVFQLPTVDDSSVEGSEEYSIDLSNASSSTGLVPALSQSADSIQTNIIDNDPANWTITGAAAATEGSSAAYTVALTGVLQSGETAAVKLELSDATTDASDRTSFVAAVNSAVSTRPDLAFDGTTLTYTGDGTPMANLVINVLANDDSLIEGPESYALTISAPASTTGSTIGLGGSTSVITTITDNDTAIWSLTGDATVGEGAVAEYTVALTGTLQTGETATVNVTLTNSQTNSTDYANFVAAVNAAVSSRPDLTFDGTTLTYTSDGNPMADLVINLVAIDDALTEGVEAYTVTISSPASTTGSDIVLGGTTSVTTTITDNDTATWSIAGDATADEGATAQYTIALAGTLQTGEIATVDLALTNIDTNSTDYAAFVAAVNAAISLRPDLAFDGTTLTYTGDGNPMTDLTINLVAIDDALTESVEGYTVSISSPTSTTGSNTALGGATSVTTTITDNDTATWSISGDATVGEGATAQYTVALAGTLQADETATVNLTLADIDTNSTDYAAFVDAVNTVISSRPDLAFDGTILTYTGDGNLMADLVIDLVAIDDALTEGAEGYSITISSPASTTGSDIALGGTTSVTTTITDNDTATWSISGDATIDEGATAQYTIALAGTLQANETATVDLALTDIDTSSTDYAAFVAAINTAISSRPDLAFDGTTLTYTGDGNPMTDLVIDLAAINDALTEGAEDYSITISSPASTTGSDIALGGTTSVTTTITDNDTATWSIAGDATVDEGATAQYTISLAGTLQADETATVNLTLADIDTNSTDYAAFVAAINTAILSRPDLAFDGTTLTYTGDGNPMTDLVIDLAAIDDALTEGAEDYSITISSPASTTGSDIALGGTTSVTTTITDNDTATWSIAGDATVDEGATAQYTISLAETLQADETATVNLTLADIDTNPTDYANFVAAINTAISSRPDLAFDGTTLTYTGDGNPMTDLVIDLAATDDTLTEGVEDYTVSISSPASTTGGDIALGGTTSITTTITDNDTTTWSITGDATIDEGATAQYTIALAGTLQANETATVDLALTDIGTNSTDYAAFIAAVNTAISSRPDLIFDGTTLTYTGDGNPMADLVINLAAIDDTLTEGVEDYSVSISSPASTTGSDTALGGATSVTTTITDNDTATWSITGDAAVDEGATAQYTIALAGTLQTGETATVDVVLTNIDTNPTDYANLIAAINTAISSRPDLAFDGTTLTYTGDGNPMTDLVIDLAATDDALTEGVENYTVSISSPASATGSDIALGGTTSVTTTISDNDTATWSIAGDATVGEGATAQYTIALAGTLQTGETATVDVALTNIDTNSTDYANFVAAINTAISSRPDLAFDGTTLTYTGDGNPMVDLVINLAAIDDALTEGVEDYSVSINSPASTTGSDIALGGTTSVTTTITDSDTATWSITGDAAVDEGATAQYTIALAGTLQTGETATVEFGLSGIDTTSVDHAILANAINSAIATRPDLTFDGTTLTYTGDGNSMASLTIGLVTIDDALVEGPEAYSVAISNPASTTGSANILDAVPSVTTTIADNDAAAWSIAGDAAVGEGAVAQYTLALSGVLQSGETATVELAISNISTTSTDYASFDAAMTAAATAYTGPGSVNWNGNALEFTSAGSGTMSPLLISLSTVDDSFGEGNEDFRIAIANPNSATGAEVTLDTANIATITTIDDTIGANPDAVTWRISGSPAVDEGGTAQYTITLSNTLGAGENAGVDLSIDNVNTNSADYGAFSAAVAAAVAQYNTSPSPGTVTWDGATLVFTSATDSDTLIGLQINLPAVDDALLEGPETFDITLTNAGSSSGVATDIDALQNSVFTTIIDNDSSQWSITGEAEKGEGRLVSYTVSLAGTFQAGETVSVGISLTDLETLPADHGDLAAAIAAASTSNPDLNFDPVTNTLTYTAPTDGAAMDDLNFFLSLSADGVLEGPERYRIDLFNPASPTGAATSVDATLSTITTTINGALFAVNDIATTGRAVPVTGNLLANDRDTDGDSISISFFNSVPVSPGGTTITTPNGSIQIDSAGTYIFTPNDGFIGVESLDYTIVDPSGNHASASFTVSVRDTETDPATTAPIANDDAINIFVGQTVSSSLISNDGDPVGQPIFINTTPVTEPQYGTVVINSDGTYTYTHSPDAALIADDFFEYEITDSDGLTDTARVTIKVLVDSNGPDNDAPVAGSDSILTTTGVTATGNLLSNDIDPNGDALMINTTPVIAPTNGSIRINADGRFVYTPDPGFVGNDEFQYEVCDPSGSCVVATVRVTIFNQPPEAVDDELVIRSTVPTTGQAFVNDSDPDGDTLTSSVFASPRFGTVDWNPDGTFVYTPGPDFPGSDSLVYSVFDANGVQRQATVSITMPNFGRVTGYPPNLPLLSSAYGGRISDQFNQLGGPGEIYTGQPIGTNANPLLLESGLPVTGGYHSEFASNHDCGCAPPVETIEVANTPPIANAICIPYEEETQALEAALISSDAPSIPDEEAFELLTVSAPDESQPHRPSFLKRFTDWLHRQRLR